MKIYTILLSLIFCFGTLTISAQDEVPAQIENISDKLTDISKTLSSLNERLKTFSDTFSSNQGLQLSARQQRVLAAFEYLNRAEERLATLQRLKIDLTEKQTSIRLKLAEVEDNLRKESIDRSVALRGTTDTEAIREIRRRALGREQNELNSLSNEISSSIRDVEQEIRETNMFLNNIRRRIFPAIDREISDL